SPVELVQQLILPNKFRSVKDVDVLYNTVLRVQGSSQESHHVSPADTEFARPLQLVGESFDLRKQVLRCCEVLIQGKRLGQVQHGDPVHRIVEGSEYKFMEFEAYARAGIIPQIQFVAEGTRY